MDYEKAYKDALKRAKRYIDSYNVQANAITESAMETAKDIFPELAESEDERIRKRLVNLIHELSNRKELSGYFTDGQGLEYVEWLEKQKEQKPAEWSEEDEKVWENVLECITTYFPLWGYERYFDWLKDLPNRFALSHWKPSEEQMEALKLIVSNKKHYAPVLHEIALDTLYNDLQKL